MSRIGKQSISLPSDTQLTDQLTHVEVVGPKGTLQVVNLPGISITLSDGVIAVERATEDRRFLQGLQRTLVQNAITGVTKGWSKELELHGVGMRAAVAGTSLNLSLGFSHPVIFDAPSGISFTVVKNVITVSGIDKQLVGETAAKIRQLRKPEPYKGKGIRYAQEHIRRKAGKTGKAK